MSPARRNEPISISGDVAELRRLRGDIASAVGGGASRLKWVPRDGTPPDIFIVLDASHTSYVLSFLPYGTNGVYLNGLLLSEGDDYTLDYSTGTVDVSVDLAAGDVLVAHYVTTGNLVAATPPPTVDVATAVQHKSGYLSGITDSHLDVTLDSAPTPGNTIVAFGAHGSSRTLVPSAGTWTELTSASDADLVAEVFVREVLPGDGATFGFDLNANGGISIVLYEISGADPTLADWTVSTNSGTGGAVSNTVTLDDDELALVYAKSYYVTATSITATGYTIDESNAVDVAAGVGAGTGSSQTFTTTWNTSPDPELQIVLGVPGRP